MAEIREFHSPEQKENKGNFTARIVKHRLGTIIKVSIVVAVVFLIGLLFVRQYKSQRYANLVVAASADKENLSDNSYLNNNGSVITYSKDGISSTDGTGKVLWNKTYEMQSPIVHQAGGVVAVCDYNGHLIYMIDSKGHEYEIDTNLPIRDFAVSKEERVAAIIEDAGNSWVNLYDAAGNQLVEIKATMSKTGYPMAVTLSDEVLGVSYFYVDGDNMRSSVTFYNFGGIGENASDHIVSSYDYADAVVPIISFLDADNVFAVADNRLMFYQGAKKPVSSSDNLLNETILGVYYGGTDVVLVYYDITGQYKYRIDMYDKSGTKVMSHSFDMDFKDILVSNSQVMIYNERQCIVLSSSGEEKYQGTFEDDVIYLSSTESNKRYIAVTENAIETLSFE